MTRAQDSSATPGAVQDDGGGHVTGHPRDDERTADVTVSEERLQVGTEREQVGSARAVKHGDVEHATSRVERGTEHADLERAVVEDPSLDRDAQVRDGRDGGDRSS